MPTNSPDPCFAGIVPSLPRTAAIFLPRRGNAPAASHFCAIEMPHGSDLIRVVQHREVVNTIVAAGHAAGAPALVAVLGHNPRARVFHHVELIELGAHLRHRIYGQDWPLVEVPPTLVNQFVTGHGDATSAELSAVLAAAYGQSFRSCWEPVAYALAHIARCLVHPDNYPAEQVRMLQVIRFAILDPRTERVRPSIYPTLHLPRPR